MLTALLFLFSYSHDAAASSVSFDSLQEGMYAIHLVCDPQPADCNSALISNVDRLTVVNTHGPAGVSVTLASQVLGVPIDTFFGLDVGPASTQLVSSPMSHGTRFSYMDAKIDAHSGAITGTLTDSESVGSYLIQGKALARVADIAGAASLPAGTPLDAFLGSYSGSIGSVPGTFLLKETPAHQVTGFFASDSTIDGEPSFSLVFDSGFWNPVLGLVQLVLQNPRYNAVGELNLALQGQKNLSGFLASAFALNPASFTLNGA